VAHAYIYISGQLTVTYLGECPYTQQGYSWGRRPAWLLPPVRRHAAVGDGSVFKWLSRVVSLYNRFYHFMLSVGPATSSYRHHSFGSQQKSPASSTFVQPCVFSSLLAHKTIWALRWPLKRVSSFYFLIQLYN